MNCPHLTSGTCSTCEGSLKLFMDAIPHLKKLADMGDMATCTRLERLIKKIVNHVEKMERFEADT